MSQSNPSNFDFAPLIQGYPALKFGRSGMAREKMFYLSGSYLPS